MKQTWAACGTYMYIERGDVVAAKRMSYCQGKGCLSHNNRDFIPNNVDPERMKDNITIKKQSITEAYKECFGEALKEYNKKQAREDRKIDDYYAHLFGNQQKNSVAVGANKQKSFYENLVQVGTKDDSGVGSADGRTVAKCLEEYARGFQERNPQFYVFNSVLHMDEATPHLHMNYIPVANQAKGMKKQNGVAKALEQMGHGTGKDAMNRWRLTERKVLENICRTHGIEISEPQKSRGSLSVEEYKALKDETKEQAQEEFNKEFDAFSDIKQEVQELRQEKAELQEWFKKEKTRDVAENKIKYDKLAKIDYGKHKDKTTPTGKKKIVPLRDYEIMRNRSEWYRRGIGLNEREKAVTERESAAEWHENENRQTKNEIDFELKLNLERAKQEHEQAKNIKNDYTNLYDEQLNINVVLKKTKDELIEVKHENEELSGLVEDLTHRAESNAKALESVLNAFEVEETSNGANISFNYRAVLESIKAEKPEHRILERVHERERELEQLSISARVR